MKRTSSVLLTVALALSAALHCPAQTIPIAAVKGFVPPADKTEASSLLASLGGFLFQLPKPNKQNSFVNTLSLPETSAEMDEMKNLALNEEKNKNDFYKPVLLEAVKISDSAYLVQFAFLGADSSGADLRGMFRLMAEKAGNGFVFSSPLKQNTISWESDQIENTTVHYRGTLNRENEKKYFDMVRGYDKRLNAPVIPTDFYCCDNFPAAMQLVGIDYKRDYNGFAKAGLSSAENPRYIEIDGSKSADFAKFDPHDLWHDRLHKILSTDSINRPVDEGTAYLYGGSWGISWPVILARFQTYAKANPKSDWLKIYNDNSVFDTTAGFPFIAAYVINALIAEKLEKEKGFPAVMELLRCGKKQKGNANYFAALEKVAGTKKEDFNKMVWALIKKSA